MVIIFKQKLCTLAMNQAMMQCPLAMNQAMMQCPLAMNQAMMQTPKYRVEVDSEGKIISTTFY